MLAPPAHLAARHAARGVGTDPDNNKKTDFDIIDTYQLFWRWFRIYLFMLSGVLRPKRRHCGVYLGTFAEFATKINAVSTQDDISKWVYSFVVARVWKAF